MAALGETFVTIVVEITVRRVHIPKTAKCTCNTSHCLGRGGKKNRTPKYCNVLVWGNSSDFSEIKL